MRGSRSIDPDQAWDVDAPVTARLRADGMVLVGKNTTPEIAWKGVTDSPLTGVTRNPIDPRMTAGGSSGGASAVVAAGMAPVAVGTDAGGSIRIPASFCGIVGFKPTHGRVPMFPASPFGPLAHAGPMTRTVEDERAASVSFGVGKNPGAMVFGLHIASARSRIAGQSGAEDSDGEHDGGPGVPAA